MKFLDLDAITADLAEVSIKLAGEIHKLVPLSFFDFVKNQRTINGLQKGENALDDVERQFEATVEMVARSFPTAPVENLRKLTVAQLNQLLHFTRQANGEVPEEVAPDATQVLPKDAGEGAVIEAEAPSIGSEGPTAA